MRTAIDATMMATDLADYLVNKNIPFRDAHAMAGKIVRVAGERNLSLEEMPLETYQAIGPFEVDVYQVFDPLKSINKEKRDWRHKSSIEVKNQIPHGKKSKEFNHVYYYLPRM